MPNAYRAPLANSDLDAIWDYVARDNPAAADDLIDTLVEKCWMLAAHPDVGELRPELAPRLRSFSVGNYVILYRPVEDGVDVARVIHGSRDVDALF